MAVRRLAEPHLQPASFAFTAENLAWAEKQIARYPEGRQQSAVIPLLWRAQEQAGGWLPQKAIEYVADLLHMANIRVLEVATFYTMFHKDKVGKNVLMVCTNIACMLRGAYDILHHIEDTLGIKAGETTPDGMFTLLEEECLAACCNAPMLVCGTQYFLDLDKEKANQALAELRKNPRSEHVI